jgi:hypothetical protein
MSVRQVTVYSAYEVIWAMMFHGATVEQMRLSLITATGERPWKVLYRTLRKALERCPFEYDEIELANGETLYRCAGPRGVPRKLGRKNVPAETRRRHEKLPAVLANRDRKLRQPGEGSPRWASGEGPGREVQGRKRRASLGQLG